RSPRRVRVDDVGLEQLERVARVGHDGRGEGRQGAVVLDDRGAAAADLRVLGDPVAERVDDRGREDGRDLAGLQVLDVEPGPVAGRADGRGGEGLAADGAQDGRQV